MEKQYRKRFEEELRGLERRLEYDGACTVEMLEGILRHLYIMSGADWGGRGEVQNISMDAAIAAHEAIISRMRYARQA
jgi:hypothetical protein